jgi:hypothetical protein
MSFSQFLDPSFVAVCRPNLGTILQSFRRTAGGYEFSEAIWADQSYTNPSWLVSIPSTKVTGLGSAATHPATDFDTAGAAAAALTTALAADPTAAQLVPSQAGQNGKYLFTDGTVTSWQTVVSGGGGVALGDSPTWTGQHTWAPTAGGAVAAKFRASTTAPGNITEWRDGAGLLLGFFSAGCNFVIDKPAADANALHLKVAGNERITLNAYDAGGASSIAFTANGALGAAGSFTISGTSVTFRDAGGSNQYVVFDGATQRVAFSHSTVTTPDAMVDIRPSSAEIGVIVKGAPSQSANLQEWKDYLGAVVMSIDALGGIRRDDGVNMQIRCLGSIDIYNANVMAYRIAGTGFAPMDAIRDLGAIGTRWANTYIVNLNASGDVEVTDATKGVILKSPNGNRWRITVTNAGTLTVTML